MYRLVYIFSLFLLFPCRLGAEPVVPSLPEYDLSVSVDVPASRLIGLASVTLDAGKTFQFDVSRLKITNLSMNGAAVEPEIRDGRLVIRTASQGVLIIEYQAEFKGIPDKRGEDTGTARGIIDAGGISLADGWYPRIDGLAWYRLRAGLPKGHEAVSEAEQVEKSAKDNTTEFLFRFDHPRDRISLIATNRYEVSREQVNGIDLYAYFFPEDRALAKTCLQKAKKYLEMYGRLLTKYPYKRLSIVENFLPVRYSLPTLTVLGKDAVRLPSHLDSSLGHEVLRQWFGNSVYVDVEKGDWAEGLTAYLAGHLYEEQAGKGWEYRKELLLDYAAYVSSKNEISLREYKGGTDRASRAIGHGKGAMVFHMLKKSLGEDVFYDGLRKFIRQKQYQPASWDDLRTAFEKQSGKDLNPFFTQWVDRKGLPELTASNGSVKRKGEPFEVGFEIKQEEKPYTLQLPAEISLMGGGRKKEALILDSEKKSFTVAVDEEPLSLVIDANYDVARKPSNPESPPVIASLLADDKPLIVPPVTNREAYLPVIAGLKTQGGEEREAADLKNSDIKSSSVVVLGNDNPVIGRLFGKVESMKAGFSLMVRKNPWNARKIIVLINASSAREAEAAFPNVAQYGKFSTLAFNEGRNVSKKIDDSQRGMEMELRQPATAIDLSTLKTLTDVIEAASGKKIVYVGEYHDRYAHHTVQLQVIKALFEKDPNLAIGMEMFQRPFQKVVDDYISGAIDEREFLKNSEYFKRWVFDYNLYKPILDFARSRKIPVVALNQKKEITEKVSKGGMDSLTDEERKEAPQQMDFADDAYRGRLKIIFDQHKGPGERSFDFFYQAQVLWDETMALSIDEFMQKNPGHRMVVIAGGGHLAYGSGIPKRSFRRNGLPYFIVMNDSEADKDIADYLVLPEPLEGTTAPKLMAVLKVENNRVYVAELPAESVAKKAGVRAGDMILALDNENVQSVEDIKLLLFYKKQGEAVKVNVLRKGFFGREKKMQFDVKL